MTFLAVYGERERAALRRAARKDFWRAHRGEVFLAACFLVALVSLHPVATLLRLVRR